MKPKIEYHIPQQDKTLLMEIAALEWRAKMRRIRRKGIRFSRSQHVALVKAAKHLLAVGHFLGFRAGWYQGNSLGRPQHDGVRHED